MEIRYMNESSHSRYLERDKIKCKSKVSGLKVQDLWKEKTCLFLRPAPPPQIPSVVE